MINIYSTEVGIGKGGISTALVGYIKEFSNKKIKYKLINTHAENKKSKLFLLACYEALRTKRDDICWFHCGPWFSMVRKLILIILCKMMGGKIIVHFHSPKMSNYSESKSLRFFLKLFFILSDKVIVVAPWWKDFLSYYYPEYKDKIIVSLNPLDDQLIKLAKSNYTKEHKSNYIHVLSLSRLVEGKGVDKTIKAFRNLPDNYRLTIAGDGPQKEYLERLIQEYDLTSRVKLIGWVDYSEKLSLYKTADIFCLPSKLDSFGMVYLEAMSANIPVIALNYQAIPNILPDFSVILLDDDNDESIANAIKSLSYIKKDLSLSTYVLDKFNASTIVNNFVENIYE